MPDDRSEFGEGDLPWEFADIDDIAPDQLKTLIEEGERSITEEGTIDGDEAFAERERQRQKMRSKS